MNLFYNSIFLFKKKGNNDVLLNMAPQTGKTIAYQLPLLIQNNNKLVVVLTPSVNVIIYHMHKLASYKIPSQSLYTLKDLIKNQSRSDVLCTLEHTKFLFITPILSEDYAQVLGSLLSQLYYDNKISYFVIDEAQFIFQKSFNVRSFYTKILQSFRKNFYNIQFVLSSTFVPIDLEKKYIEIFDLKNSIIIHDIHNISQFASVLHIRHKNVDNHYERIIKILNNYNNDLKDDKVSGIIYCRKM